MLITVDAIKKPQKDNKHSSWLAYCSHVNISFRTAFYFQNFSKGHTLETKNEYNCDKAILKNRVITCIAKLYNTTFKYIP